MADDTDVAKRTSREFLVESIRLSGPMRYDAHRHEQHQIAWMASGEMELAVDGVQLHMHRGHLVWIPSNLRHQMTIPTGGHLITAYAAPHVRPGGSRWNRLAVTPATVLLRALLTDLTASEITRRRRGLAQALLFDALETSLPSQDVLAVPDDPRARVVADAILHDLADPTDLAEWAERLGVNAKTLTRAFVAATGLTFRQWRTTARMHRARAMLATGAPITETSAAVGYRSPSAFITAYRTTLGTTPGRDGATNRRLPVR
jgi:AraC-like DNA-binding protein